MAHGAVRFLLRALEAAFLVLLLGAAVLAWRLSQGPITLTAVAPYVASILSDLNPALQFRLEHADFKWQGFKGNPEITARNVRVLDSAGSVIAGLPTMVVRLDSSALLKGRLAPNHISLSNPIIRFLHRADGTFVLGLGGGPALVSPGAEPRPDEASGTAVAATLLRALTQTETTASSFAYLETVAIEHTTLVLLDEASDQRWLVPDATMNFTRDRRGMKVEATLPVIEDGKPWLLTAKGTIAAASRMLELEINVDGIRPARFAILAPQLQPLAMIDLRLSGVASATLALDERGARISGVNFNVKGQAGHLRLPAPLNKDYAVKSLALRGSAGEALNEIKLDEFRIEVDAGPVLTMTADAKGLNGSPTIAIAAAMDELSIDGLKAYWPDGIKPNTLRWIRNNLTDGALSDTRLKMTLSGSHFAEITPTEMVLTSALHDMTVNYLGQMPKVRGTRGAMTLTLRDFTIALEDGYVPDAMSDVGLRVPGGTLRMIGLGGGSETADFNIKIAGDFGAAMRLIDHAPLGYATKMGIDPSRATGEVAIDLGLTFPLVTNLRLDQIDVKVGARAEDIGLANVAFGLPLSQGEMVLALDDAGMDVSGRASLGSIPTRIEWRENFSGGEFRSRYVLDPVIGNDQRPLIGLSTMPFIPPYLDGPVNAHVIYTVYRDQTRRMEADVDLTAPRMAIPELGWQKEPGIPAAGKVTADFINDQLQAVPAFSVTSGTDLNVSGSAKFGPARTMTELVIAPSTAGASSISMDLRRENDGYLVNINGPSLDAVQLLRELNRRNTPDRAPETPVTPFVLRAAFDRMWFVKDSEFRSANLTYVRDQKGVRSIDFHSLLDGVTPVTFTLDQGDGARHFKGESDDGGGVVRSLGLFKDLVGGKLEMSGELAADGTMRGVAEIHDFKLIEAPVLARLLSVAALTGILDELRGEGISFKTLRLPFSFANSQLNIEDGEMYGSSLGVTAKGTYRFAESSMDLNGTLIPAYAINSVLSSIPLIGDLLTGGDKGGGIFAATYTYRGPIATAEPSVNPLAALAPGFMRHIFDIFRSRPRQQAQSSDPARSLEPAASKPSGYPQ